MMVLMDIGNDHNLVHLSECSVAKITDGSLRMCVDYQALNSQFNYSSGRETIG
jgi:hypothetical protein